MLARWALTVPLCSLCLSCETRVIVGYATDEPTSDTGLATSSSTTGPATEGSTAAATSTSGGDSQALGLPERGDLLWSAGFETGDVSEWLMDDRGQLYLANDARHEVGIEHVHSGSQAFTATVVSIGDQLPQAMLLREFDVMEGYYSAHFCVTENYDTNFLVIMKFRSDAPFQGSSSDDRFDIDLSRDTEDHRLYLQLDEHGGEATLSPIPVPIETWFKIEVFYRSTPNDDGRLVVWQDGVLVFDTGPRPTAPSSHVVFGTGIAAWRVSPLPASVSMDTVEVYGIR